MGRYERLFTLPANLYTEGAPLLIAAGALLRDGTTGKVLAQLKFTNICAKTVRAVKVRITPFDTVGRPLGAAAPFTYLDLAAARDTDFGQKTPIPLTESEARSFTVAVEEVAFADNSLWALPAGTVWEPLPAPETVEEALRDRELARQYALKYGQNHTIWPLRVKDLWLCSCGALNHAEETACHRCSRPAKDLAVDVEALKAEAAVRLEQERLAAEEAARTAAQAAKAAAVRKKAKIVKLAVLAVFIVLVIVAVPFVVKQREQAAVYAQAEAWLDAQNPTMAALYFKQVEGYKDAQERYMQCLQEAAPAHRKVIDSYSGTFSMLNTDGTVRITGDNEYENPGEQNEKAGDWSDIVAVASGYGFTAGLRADGTVAVVGSDWEYEIEMTFDDKHHNYAEDIDVSDWQGITAISAGWGVLAGIKSDGTVVVTGDTDALPKSSEWQDIASFAWGADIFPQAIGVKKDGTVSTYNFDAKIKKAVKTWTDITCAAVGSGLYNENHIVGLKKDGTVVAVGGNEDGQCNVKDWENIIAIDACNSATSYTVGLRSDGTVVTTLDWLDVEDWTDIIAVAAGGNTVYGLRADGKVLSTDGGGAYNIVKSANADMFKDTKPEKDAAPAPASKSLYAPGEYSASAQGIGGEVTVTMTFNEKAITDMQVDAPGETADIGGAAVPLLEERIMAEQSADVDAVAGATVTSDAIKEAAANCIAQARN